MIELEPQPNEGVTRPRKRSNAFWVALPLVSCLGWMLVGGLFSTIPAFQPRVELTGNLIVTWTRLGPTNADGIVQNAGTAPVEGPAMYVQFPGGVGGRHVTFPQHTTTAAWQHVLRPGESEPFTVSVQEVGTLAVSAVLGISNGYSPGETKYRQYAYQQQLALRPERRRFRRRRR